MAPLLSSQEQPSLPAPSQGLIHPEQSLGKSLPPKAADNDRSSGELGALDCNLAALCDHIQVEGFSSGIFSDVVVQAMGVAYSLHRLILSRSSYFRNMLHGPWKESGLPTLVLYIDDPNVNSEAITVALAYLYGHYPKLNDINAFRVLAVASFLDLQDLCAICTDFIIYQLWTSNFLSYQVFAESQDYGIHGERVRNACWGYLCQSATTELREVLPKLSPQILHALFTSDELWVPNEEQRFELVLHALLLKAAMSDLEHGGEESFSSAKISTSDTPGTRGKSLIDAKSSKQLVDSELCNLSLEDKLDTNKAAPIAFLEHSDHVAGCDPNFLYMSSLQGAQRHQVQDARFSLSMVQATSSSSLVETNAYTTSCSYIGLQTDVETKLGINEVPMEGSSGESHCYHIHNKIWLSEDQSKVPSGSPSTKGAAPSECGRCNMPSWGGRIVGRGNIKGVKSDLVISDEEFAAFMNIFEGGSLLYCNMSFEALLNVRRQLEELDFPGKAVNDGLWLQSPGNSC